MYPIISTDATNPKESAEAVRTVRRRFRPRLRQAIRHQMRFAVRLMEFTGTGFAVIASPADSAS